MWAYFKSPAIDIMKKLTLNHFQILGDKNRQQGEIIVDSSLKIGTKFTLRLPSQQIIDVYESRHGFLVSR